MKIYRILGIIFSLLVVLSCMSACMSKTYTYQFEQGQEQIETVTLWRYDSGDYSGYDLLKRFRQIKTFDEDTAQALITDISNMDAYRHFGGHAQGSFGHIVVIINYQDGTRELIGMVSAAVADASGKWRYKTVYWFESLKWRDLILKYVDASLVPELMEYV